MKKPTQVEVLSIVSLITKKPLSEIKPHLEIKGHLGMDSLAALDLLVTIEEDYGLVIDQTKAAQFKTIQDVLDYIEKM